MCIGGIPTPNDIIICVDFLLLIFNKNLTQDTLDLDVSQYRYTIKYE